MNGTILKSIFANTEAEGEDNPHTNWELHDFLCIIFFLSLATHLDMCLLLFLLPS